MTTLTFGQALGFSSDQLRVPSGTSEMSVLEAALAWSAAGFYVLPVRPETKHAGSVVGKGWPDKSSRCPDQINSWFIGQNYGIAIHVGRSGAIAFDVDRPSSAPQRLRDYLEYPYSPFQSTRLNDRLRGHYLFSVEEGSNYGNSPGRLGRDWGEVRGRNGIIIVAPTPHPKRAEDGRYFWVREGVVPHLPLALRSRLPNPSSRAEQAASGPEIFTFVERHIECLNPSVLDQHIRQAQKSFLQGSRHDTARNLLMVCLREAMAGLYPARTAIEEIAFVFQTFKPPTEWSSPTEFRDLLGWVVAQINTTSDEELRSIREVSELMSSTHVQQWLGDQK